MFCLYHFANIFCYIQTTFGNRCARSSAELVPRVSLIFVSLPIVAWQFTEAPIHREF